MCNLIIDHIAVLLTGTAFLGITDAAGSPDGTKIDFLCKNICSYIQKVYIQSRVSFVAIATGNVCFSEELEYIRYDQVVYFRITKYSV